MENLKTMVSQLTDDEVNTLYTMAMTAKLRELLGNQPIPQDFSFMELTAYLDEYKGKRDEYLLLFDIFNYGRIYGIKQERARRARSTQEHYTILDKNN
jgi:hypothetical protein